MNPNAPSRTRSYLNERKKALLRNRRKNHQCSQCGLPVAGNPKTKKPFWRCSWCRAKQKITRSKAA